MKPMSAHSLRIVCLSDTHCQTDFLKVPEGDILIVAGDICLNGRKQELYDFDEFLGRLPHKHKVFVAGNHDIPFANVSTKEAKALLKNAVYLENSGIEIDGVKFWGSPWQPEFFNWAFNLPRGPQLAKIWAQIPNDTDVLVTHTPPYGRLDRIDNGEHVGCEDLSDALRRVQPKLHVFGHIHEDRGVLEQNGTTFINACICNRYYMAVYDPIVFDLHINSRQTRMTMCNTPGFSGKMPVIEQPGVETFQCCFPQDPGKFCTLINTPVR
jgi:Icc-related predicted phosphoesterase